MLTLCIVICFLYILNLEEMNIDCESVPIALMGDELDKTEWPTYVGHIAIINCHRV